MSDHLLIDEFQEEAGSTAEAEAPEAEEAPAAAETEAEA